MCGIVGFWHSEVLNKRDLERMVLSIKHRGPDDEGYYLDDSNRTGLGHCRLSILDLSDRAHQPMTYFDSGLWIIFNGEIFNFIEIKSELIQKGYRFKSESDTEVILAAYIEWGLKAFEKFNGMWAFAIYDEKSKKLVLCRDRYGIKPLYYFYDGKQLVFVSEWKAFWAVARKLGISWDLRGIKSALINSFQLESSGFTLLEKVKNLFPGHYLIANGSQVDIKQWWKTMDHLVEVPLSLNEQAEQFRDIFLDASRLRMRSDVPIGTSLSGGLDSSSVVVSINRVAKDSLNNERISDNWQKTFIHTFIGTSMDETDYADEVADSVKVEKIYVTADASGIQKELDKILYHFETIYPGMPDSLWRVYQAQRLNGVVVTLDGHGGDELLGGYDWHISSAMRDLSMLSPQYWALLQMKRESYGYALPSHFFIKTLLQSIPVMDFIKEGLKKFVYERFLNSNADGFESYYANKIKMPPNWSHFKKELYKDLHQWILPKILKNFDVMSMAHGVEVRMPFLDYRLVNFVFSLPESSIIGNGYTKLVLREAMKGLLPENVRLRKTKIGFNSPVVEWFQKEIKEWIEETLENPSYANELISLSKMKRFYFSRICTGHFKYDEGLRFWTCLNAMRLVQIMNNHRSNLERE